MSRYGGSSGAPFREDARIVPAPARPVIWGNYPQVAENTDARTAWRGSNRGTQTFVVFLAAALTALATGLGALPFAFGRFEGERILGISNALAAGVMLGASVSLLWEGGSRNVALVLVGALAGGVFVYGLQALFRHIPTPDVASLTGHDARKALLIIAVMTAHSVAEGVGVGASFGGGETLGWLITIAIAIHNIPEGIAVSLVLVPRGARVRSAALWSIFTSLPQPLLAVPAYLFVEQFTTILPAGLGFAAGAMIWMVVRELAPEALRQVPRRRVAVGWMAGAFAAMFAFQTLLLA